MYCVQESLLTIYFFVMKARPLAEAVFVSKLTGNKREWRFFDFADFAISFGTAPLEVRNV